ncbi:metal-dependent phosphoesterase [Methanocella sp. CWC-04]|uniref:Metal-dependent phosphoesterase n=1 Tax=Methanooceanicella nereidis TaxID=2052831 RepID=A0AAP2W5P4_9EURY|nr:PHP domain-containing protein [Methanocella sp. CWC-04]MCD1294312.1 metal-dependent phosphoesterase [Methanocella sp. CWC-04]
MLIDTHTHTDLSDGLEDTGTVLSKAAAMGMDIISITDHDCIKAYPKAFTIAESYGIHMVPGVELTTKNEKGCNCIHIVGLGIDTGSEVSAVLEKITKSFEDSEWGFLENVNKFMSERHPGWIPATKIKPSVFRNTIESANQQGINISEKEMMDIIFNPDLWVPIEFEITLEDAVSYIKDWGGVPVLAHPFDFSNDVNVVLKRFLDAGGEAIEVCKYRYKARTEMLSTLPVTELVKKEREMNLWTIEQAKKHGLKITMASDHHDDTRVMGMNPEEYGIDIMWLYDL